jgi:antitoxin Phd
MAAWQVQEAKARLSELIERARDHGPQIITKHGSEQAVVLSIAEYKTLLANRKPTFNEFLLNAPKVEDFEIERDKDTGREIEL